MHLFDGASPSGKAPDFDSGIPRFESWRPSHLLKYEIYIEFDVALRGVDEKDEVTNFILFTFWLLALQNIDSQGTLERLHYFLDKIDIDNLPAKSLAASLSSVASALDLYESCDYAQALAIMEALEREGSLVKELPDPEFYYFLGICHEKCHNITVARQAFEQALQLILHTS